MMKAETSINTGTAVLLKIRHINSRCIETRLIMAALTVHMARHLNIFSLTTLFSQILKKWLDAKD
jgi:hypothetical protein